MKNINKVIKIIAKDKEKSLDNSKRIANLLNI